MKLVYINDAEPIEIPERLSKKQQLQQDAIETMLERKQQDAIEAKELFTEEREQLKRINKQIEDFLKTQ